MIPGLSDPEFDDYGEFVPEHLPDPGPFLEEGEVLRGERHAAVHRTARERFEERGVHDATFGYNLARLNLDPRHPDAGFRYARDGDDLLAEFTPTTPFCPQSRALATGAARAWNDGDHEYGRVRVRVAPMHQASGSINEALRALDAEHGGV